MPPTTAPIDGSWTPAATLMVIGAVATVLIPAIVSLILAIKGLNKASEAKTAAVAAQAATNTSTQINVSATEQTRQDIRSLNEQVTHVAKSIEPNNKH